MSRPGLSVMGLFLALFSVSGVAFAQATPNADDKTQSTVNVSLRGEVPNLRLVVLPVDPPEGDSELDPPIKVCRRDCSLALPPGRYRLKVSGPIAGNVLESTAIFTVSKDSEVSVNPATLRGRFFGLTLGIVGSVVTGLGTVFAVGAALIVIPMECEGDCHKTRTVLWAAEVGGALILVGGAIAAPGWTLWVRNREPMLTVTPVQRQSTALRNLQIGPVRLPNGWGLGGEMRF
jgi:hypothetical protein